MQSYVLFFSDIPGHKVEGLISDGPGRDLGRWGQDQDVLHKLIAKWGSLVKDKEHWPMNGGR